MPNNFEVKLKDHYKLYVLLKDKIKLESELENNRIMYYSDVNEQPFIGGGIRYFFLDSDREKVDQILMEKDIIASTETIPSYDYREQKKISRFYLALILAIFLAVVLFFFLSD